MAAEQPGVQLIAIPGHAWIGHKLGGMGRQAGGSSGGGRWTKHMTRLQGGGHLELGSGNEMRIVLRRQLRRSVDVGRQRLDVRQAGLTLRHRWSSGSHGKGANESSGRHARHHHGSSSSGMHHGGLWIIRGRLLLLLLWRCGMWTADQQSGR